MFLSILAVFCNIGTNQRKLKMELQYDEEKNAIFLYKSVQFFCCLSCSSSRWGQQVPQFHTTQLHQVDEMLKYLLRLNSIDIKTLKISSCMLSFKQCMSNCSRSAWGCSKHFLLFFIECMHISACSTMTSAYLDVAKSHPSVA